MGRMDGGRLMDRHRRRRRLERLITCDQARQIPARATSERAEEGHPVDAKNRGVGANNFEPDHPLFELASRCSVGFHLVVRHF